MSDGNDCTRLVYVRDGGPGERQMVLGTVADLADEMKNSAFTDYEVGQAFALDDAGDLVAVPWQVAGELYYDDDQRGVLEVVVTLPDSRREIAAFTIDGAA